MHFCSKCDNMYYIKLMEQNNNNLVYYCRHCGNEDVNITSKNVCVSKTSFKTGGNDYKQFINKYTKQDPTLPRINTIPCPNSQCETNTSDKPREIIFIRYDEENIKYIYLCSSCNTTWHADKNK